MDRNGIFKKNQQTFLDIKTKLSKIKYLLYGIKLFTHCRKKKKRINEFKELGSITKQSIRNEGWCGERKDIKKTHGHTQKLCLWIYGVVQSRAK